MSVDKAFLFFHDPPPLEYVHKRGVKHEIYSYCRRTSGSGTGGGNGIQ